MNSFGKNNIPSNDFSDMEDAYISGANNTKSFSQWDVANANATGFGAAADDFMERGIDLNEQLVRNRPATYFMRVNSDAMIECGIYKGDVVIVDRSIKPVNAKVVIAVLNGDMLIRRLEKIKNNFRLLTDGNKLSPINIDNTCEDFFIWGVVTYVIHSL
jgi:DNA polymerase V